MTTRTELLEGLAKDRDRLLEGYRALTPAQLDQVCTESEAEDGAPWRSKDHLAHLAMIERAFAGMARRTVANDPKPVAFSGTTREEAIAGVHRNNETNVESHRDDAIDALLADLEEARRETLKLVDELTDDQLDLKITGAPWGDGTIGGVLRTAGLHERQHLAWVQAGLNPSD
jgi:hypothetical protein